MGARRVRRASGARTDVVGLAMRQGMSLVADGSAIGLLLGGRRTRVRVRYVLSCRAMNAFTIWRARSVCGPGFATHSCSESSNS